jgi:hypothetical protein
MWKITTRGFTLEEVLILAAMNLLASADAANARNGRRRNKQGGHTWQKMFDQRRRSRTFRDIRGCEATDRLESGVKKCDPMTSGSEN